MVGRKTTPALHSGMVPYERFDAWKIAHQLALEVYEVTERWPTNERYGLTAQIRRAAISAPTNIAEGAAKRGPRELRRYLDIALGSLSEVSYLLRFTRDRGILNDDHPHPRLPPYRRTALPPFHMYPRRSERFIDVPEQVLLSNLVE
jgi:four helix bundle protein